MQGKQSRQGAGEETGTQEEQGMSDKTQTPVFEEYVQFLGRTLGFSIEKRIG